MPRRNGKNLEKHILEDNKSFEQLFKVNSQLLSDVHDLKIDVKRFNERGDRIELWMKDIDTKLNDHLLKFTQQMTQLRIDVDWLKRFFWLVAGGSLSAITVAIFSLIMK